jgi:esterase/lipase superfamily enzyme
MARQYWMISNRDNKGDYLGPVHSSLSYWTWRDGPLDALGSWDKVSLGKFRSSLAKVADAFPPIEKPEDQENQKHVTLFIHGYNNSWQDAVRRYEGICNDLFGEEDGLGICVLFTWPSDAMALGYLPDRMDARQSADDLADVLSVLYDWLADKQVQSADDPAKACHAKTSVIAHSMGNYVLQCAMQVCWTRKNQPLLMSLINQLLMVAADVDNDLFKGGETTDKSDGDAIANLTYRVTALYSGLDSTLGLSAGIKHFGKRRLGRSGLDPNSPPPDNVWAIDCTPFIPPDSQNVHSIYFQIPKILELMRQLLRGVDRQVLVNRKVAPGAP